MAQTIAFRLQCRLVTNRLLQLAAVWRSCCSHREAAKSSNNVARVICRQRRCVQARPLLQSLHWLPVQQRIQYKIAVITHKTVDFCSAIHRRTPTTPSDRRCLCGPPTHRVSLCRGHALRQPSECSVWRLWTSGTDYRMTFATPVHYQPSKTHFLLMHIRDEHTHLAPRSSFSWH